MSFFKTFLNTLTRNCKEEVRHRLVEELMDLPESYFEKKGCNSLDCKNCKNSNCKIQTGEITGDVTNSEFIQHFISSLSEESKKEVYNKIHRLIIYLHQPSTQNNILNDLLHQDFIWPDSYANKRGCKYCDITSCTTEDCPVKIGKRIGNATNQDYFSHFFSLIPKHVSKKMNALVNTKQ